MGGPLKSKLNRACVDLVDNENSEIQI